MVSDHACVRMDKMAMPLLEDGYNVHVLARKMPAYASFYNTFAWCEDVGQTIEAIKVYSKVADVFHCHNEPSWFVTMVKENTDVPVILDVHDSFLARVTVEEADEIEKTEQPPVRVTAEERNNFQLADGLIFPGNKFRELVCVEFKLTQPALTLPSYCFKRVQMYDCKEWLGGLVYEGRVDLKKEIGISKRINHGFKYDDYEEFATKAKELGIDFHLYGRNDDEFMKVYKDLAIVQQPQPYQKLMMKLSRHDWGLVGNLHSTPEWEVAFPNKIFEYISACVPVVSINAQECGEFITQEGVGISVKSLEELCTRWSEHTEIRKTLIKKRQKFVMDNNIYKLEDFYEKIITTYKKNSYA